ncbi:lipase [Burkholderia sp. AU19243]|uniref:lipase family protein n=1 Tax=Burkholderia sp. AU19243 TaxID=2824810 RepID=UPI001B92DF49|nr:lipase [Burkholderia sp. AU19243]MBR8143232.1 lipase [Burkholderia vietnamiensis]MBR8363691.1 lipase [Burkholderia sp. AU19243]
MPNASLEQAQTNLTLAYIVNYSATDYSSGKEIRNPTAAQVSQNIRNGLSYSRMTQNKQFNIVWGPAVLRDPDPDGYAANITVVLKSAVTGQYSVVTSGTDFQSPADLLEDNLYETLVSFQKYVPSCNASAGISAGTDIGLSSVILTTDSNGVTLVDFLKTVPASSTISVVGHSLGGALASALVLYLKNQRHLQALTLKYTCETFAAPTAGNDLFAGYFDAQMKTDAVRVWNTCDIVPMAWNTNTIDAVKTVYGSVAPPSDAIKVLIDAIMLTSAPLNYRQWGNYGSVQNKLDGTVVGNITDFFEQAGFQHILGYIFLLGLGLGDIHMPPPPPTADN